MQTQEELTWLGWPNNRLQTWDQAEQAAGRATLENELPAALAAHVRAQGWFDVPWADETSVVRVRADRWPTVDAYEAILAGDRAVPGRYLESWRLPGELDGYAPAGLALWVWRSWELDGLAALRAASHRICLDWARCVIARQARSRSDRSLTPTSGRRTAGPARG